jgi:hypothetical protein
VTINLFSSYKLVGKYLSHVTKLNVYTQLIVFGSILTTNTNNFLKQLYPIGIANGGNYFLKKLRTDLFNTF